MPPLDQLVKRNGNVAEGRVVFNTTGTCNKCHIVNGIGREIGPNLSEIGKKLSKQAFFESILYPAAGISHNYESYTVVTTGGEVLTGLIVSDTAEGITLKDSNGLDPHAEAGGDRREEEAAGLADAGRPAEADDDLGTCRRRRVPADAEGRRNEVGGSASGGAGRTSAESRPPPVGICGPPRSSAADLFRSIRKMADRRRAPRGFRGGGAVLRHEFGGVYTGLCPRYDPYLLADGLAPSMSGSVP